MSRLAAAYWRQETAGWRRTAARVIVDCMLRRRTGCASKTAVGQESVSMDRMTAAAGGIGRREVCGSVCRWSSGSGGAPAASWSEPWHCGTLRRCCKVQVVAGGCQVLPGCCLLQGVPGLAQRPYGCQCPARFRVTHQGRGPGCCQSPSAVAQSDDSDRRARGALDGIPNCIGTGVLVCFPSVSSFGSLALHLPESSQNGFSF